jgi:glycosyltransferase involved in cell wall biosynthesis
MLSHPDHVAKSPPLANPRPSRRFSARWPRLVEAAEGTGHAQLRVLMVVESSAGGTGRHVMDLSEGLIARGCEVHMAYSPARMDRVFQDRLHGLRGLHHTAVEMRRNIHPGDIAALRAIRGYLRACGPFDVIHGHSSKGGALARLAAVATRVPAFYTLHGLIMTDPAQARWKRLLYRSIERGLSLLSDRIITVSPETERAAVSLGLGRGRVIMVPNGIGPMAVTPRAEARKALGVSDDIMVIGFVGRLVNQKAPELLVEAAARTAQILPRTRLAIVGSGPLESSLRELAGRLGVCDRILWLGQRDAKTVLAGFDVFAMSSRYEGLPYVLLEAMAAGLPVVATKSSGGELLIQPGVNGTLVPSDDPAALAEALTSLLRVPERLVSYGQAARRRVSEFTVDQMVDRTLGAYLSVVAKTVARGRSNMA